MLEESLRKNTYLSMEIKENIKELVNTFINTFPSIDLTNFYKKLETLKIKKISKFLSKDISKYDALENTIYFNLKKINEDYDMKHVLMFELLNIISNNGFNDHDNFLALNSGFTELLANALVGNEANPIYKEEAVYANVISIMVGVDLLKDAYFNNNPSLITDAIEKVGGIK